MAILLKESLDLCGFLPGERFHVAAIRDGKIQAAVFFNTANLDEALSFLNERGDWNLYLCGNPVKGSFKGNRPSIADIETQRIMLVDIDPAQDGADPVSVAESVYGFLDDSAAVIDSGRGAQVWARVNGYTDESCRRLGLGIEAKFKHPSVKFDHLFDAARLMRLPGSVNHKTGRTAEILYTGNHAGIVDWGIVESLPEPAPKPAPVEATKPATVIEMSFVRGDAKQTWDTPEEDRSKRDCRFTLEVLRNGANEAQARALLWALPNGKACTESHRADYYWGTVIEWAKLQLAGDEAKRLLALSLREKVKDDPGAPFESRNLDALKWVKQHNLADWHRIRAVFKEHRKIPLKQLEVAIDSGGVDGEPPETEGIARYAICRGRTVGWFYKTDGHWITASGSDLRSFFRGNGVDVDKGVRDLMAEPWEMVSVPFQGEELPTRRWNKDAPKLAFEPKKGPHPYWDLILRNIGGSINDAARAKGFKDGADYLRTWIASMVQHPFEPTAYLFMHGEQGGGKSLLHEALRPLFTRGVVIANNSLVNSVGFNGEIANSILCVVEEIDLSDGRKTAYNRVKMWVTGKEICVHAKHCQPFDLPNTTHWIQCANALRHCPALPGDTRVTVIRVDVVEDQTPKEVLLSALLEEGPAFLHTITTMVVPTSTGRLRVPALDTADKADHLKSNKTELEIYLEDHPKEALEESEETLLATFLDCRGVRSSWDRERAVREFPAELRSLRRFACEVKALAPWEGRASDLEPRVRELQGPRRIGRALAKLAKSLGWITDLGHKSDGEYWKVI